LILEFVISPRSLTLGLLQFPSGSLQQFLVILSHLEHINQVALLLSQAVDLLLHCPKFLIQSIARAAL